MADDFRRWYDFLAPSPDANYGSVLPFAYNREGTPAWVQEGSNLRLSMPEWLRTMAQGVVGLGESTQTGQLTPEALSVLTSGSTGTGALFAPRGALAAGAARTQKPAPGVYPQYAEVYPPVGPPVAKLDEIKTKKAGEDVYFPSRTQTPETSQFMKDRLRIKHDMEENGYTRFFDPAKRYDVDPSKYPPMVDTTQTQLMAKEKTRAQYDAKANDPEALAGLNVGYQRGLQQADDAGNWYMMGQLEKEFIKEYGAKEGRRLFKERFADAMAATTGGMDPERNLLVAHYGNYLKNRGESFPTEPHQVSYPVLPGKFGLSNNLKAYDEMIMQGGGLTDANPKKYRFSGNFLGNRSGATIDDQMMTPYGKQAPETGSYGHYESAVARQAQAAGVDPRYFQEVTWAGLKDIANEKKGGFKAQPMIDIVNEAIERTARLTGLSPAEVVRRGLVRSEIPLYSRAGGVPMPGFNVVPPQQPQQAPPPGFRVGKDMVF